jgi:uncharacterized protein (TIGR02246 family)
MKTLILAVLLAPSLALGASPEAGAKHETSVTADPMANWTPPKVKSEAKDKQEIQALLRAMESAATTGDLDAAAALVDFPVTMITDDSKGEASGDAWSREQWTQVMKPFYEKPMKDAKTTHKPTIFLLTDSLASVDDVWTMRQGGKTMTSRTSMLVIRKEGKWRVKAMAEGGWGDMGAAPEGAAGGASGAEHSATPPAGEAQPAPVAPAPGPTPATPATPSGKQAPERTTK